MGALHSSSASPNGLSHTEFAYRYFGMEYADFHLVYLEELEKMPPGNILMAMFPPEHGKTTMFENYASEKLATDPDHRMIVVSENRDIARKIGGRVKARMEPLGPAREYVRDWGPFKPPMSRETAQPWGADFFNVYKKRDFDERDYSMSMLGAGSSIVSSRADHLHIDDLE